MEIPIEAIIKEISIRDSGYTVIVIPHDIDVGTLTAVDGEVERRVFNQIGLIETVRYAERVRLDKEYQRTSKRLKAEILPEE